MQIPRSFRGGLLIVGAFAGAFALAHALTSTSSQNERAGGHTAHVRQQFDQETGCPIDPSSKVPERPWRIASARQEMPIVSTRQPTVKPLSDEEELTPISERMENDPVLKAMVLGSPGDPAELINGIEALRDYMRSIREDHACLDAHGYLENGEGRLVEFRLIVDDDERNPAHEIVVDTEVLGEGAHADDADDIKRCLDGMFVGTHPPRRRGSGVGYVLVRWVLTGNGIKAAPLAIPAGARLPNVE